jgi:hypothetical protein
LYRSDVCVAQPHACVVVALQHLDLTPTMCTVAAAEAAFDSVAVYVLVPLAALVRVACAHVMPCACVTPLCDGMVRVTAVAAAP